MKTRITNLLKVAALITAFASPSALAADDVEPGTSDGWVPVQHLRFTDEDVRGGIADPDGDLIQVVQPAVHSSLIEIRQSLEAEILKTMDDF
jgi:hypothetical protein